MPRPVFLAAPDRGAGALGLIDKILLELQVVTGGALRGSHVFVPHLQAGDVGIDADADAWRARCMDALREARVVVAVLDGPEVTEDVAWIVGHAHARGTPVIGYATDGRRKGPLVEGACRAVVGNIHALRDELAKVLLP